MEKKLVELENLLKNREEQLEREYQHSYNYAFIVGEISGIKKAIEVIKQIK